MQIALGNMANLIILILLIHEHRIYFHLFKPSSISKINVLQFSVYKSFASLYKYIFKYCILFFRSCCKWNCLLSFFFFYGSLIAYRYITDFYVFILCSVPLMSQLISSKIFFGGVFGISIQQIMSSANRDILSFPFRYECLLLIYLG